MGALDDFRWTDGERLLRFGAGAVAEAPELLEERDFEGYALLTTERATPSAPALSASADVVLHVPPGSVADGAAAVREGVGGRAVVALGGGRVVDAAKAVAAADGLACAAIPTTLSGAPVTPIHRMPAGVEGVAPVRPSLVVADPGLMASQPMPHLAASAMNALAHAVEALYVPGRGPVTDLAALRAVELISLALSVEEPHREGLALGALLGGYAVGVTGLALHHVICQTLVAVAGSPHAETNAVMLPHSISFVAERAPGAIGRLAEALGAEERDASLAKPAAASVAARSGVMRLCELGVEEAVLSDVLSAAAGRPQLSATPGGAPGEEELSALLRGAL